MITITVPCVAAHLLVTPQPCPSPTYCPPMIQRTCKHSMVLRFLPTDADTECETCGGDGWVVTELWNEMDGVTRSQCPNCPDTPGRRPLRAGDRIAIRADDDVPHRDGVMVGPYLFRRRGRGDLDYPHSPHYIRLVKDGQLAGPPIVLHPGEVVGHATVADVLQITGRFPPQDSWRDPWRIITAEPWPIVTSWPGYGSAHPEVALFDHVNAGLVFTPGQVALELTDVEAA